LIAVIVTLKGLWLAPAEAVPLRVGILLGVPFEVA
jgi:hypothetical protein